MMPMVQLARSRETTDSAKRGMDLMGVRLRQVLMQLYKLRMLLYRNLFKRAYVVIKTVRGQANRITLQDLHAVAVKGGTGLPSSYCRGMGFSVLTWESWSLFQPGGTSTRMKWNAFSPH
eukprot:817282-Rhodomonas_salina.1